MRLRVIFKYLLKFFFIIVLFFFISNIEVFSMNNDLLNLDGFNIFKWGMSIENIEFELEKNEIKYEFSFMKISPEYKFIIDDMETILFFDEDKLYNVQQYKRYQTNEKIKSESFFNNIIKKLKKKYGEPSKISENKERNLKELFWIGTKTEIHLCFFYNAIEIQVHWSRRSEE